MRTSLVTIFSSGTPLSLTSAAKVVRVLSTKQTLSSAPSSVRMTVKQRKHHTAVSYQVMKKKGLTPSFFSSSLFKIKIKLLFKMNLITRTVAKMDKVSLVRLCLVFLIGNIFKVYPVSTQQSWTPKHVQREFVINLNIFYTQYGFLQRYYILELQSLNSWQFIFRLSLVVTVAKSMVN